MNISDSSKAYCLVTNMKDGATFDFKAAGQAICFISTLNTHKIHEMSSSCSTVL